MSEEKLAGVDQALADLGKEDSEIAELRARAAKAETTDLDAVDRELSALSEGVAIDPADSIARTEDLPGADPAEDAWSDEETDVEILDESDFVLLVDESDLDQLEKVGEDDAARMTTPPEIPKEAEEDDDGFLRKLFGGRRSRPPQP